MMKKQFEYIHKATSKEYLVALIYYPCFRKLLQTENSIYQELNRWLSENENSLLAEETALPSLKDIAKDLQIKTSRLTKNIKSIYEDIIDLNEKQPFLFKKKHQKLCFLSFNYLNQYAHFNLGLDVIPKVGDGFHFGFIKPINGGDSFHVKDVVHSYENGVHEVCIYLTSEYPIGYMQLLKEKAYLHRDISFSELLSSTNFSLEEKLVKMHKNP